MKCPACPGELTSKPAGQIVVDVCEGGCGGIWFDNFELKKIDENGVAALRDVWRSADVKVDFARRRKCPRCPEQTMMRRFFSRSHTVEIDECPACGGLWLDAGEFERILQELRPRAETPPILASTMTAAITLLRTRPAPAP
jgi:Zn-finger nucleic acid-binding protein